MYGQMFGFGLTVGWLWLFFLSGPVFTAALKKWPGNQDIYFLFFMLCTLLTFFFASILFGQAVFIIKKKLFVLCTLLLSVSSGLIYLLPVYNINFCLHYSWIIYPLIALGSIGITLLLFGWLETFLAVSVKRFTLAYTGGVTIASVLLFVSAGLDFQSGIFIVQIIPWLGLMFILKKTPDFSLADPVNHRPVTPLLKVLPLKLVWLIILFYTAGGLMFKLVGTKYLFAGFFWISNISYLVVVILAGLAVYYIENLDLRLLYRPVLPMLATGFILFPFLTGKLALIPFLFLQAGFALFDMYTWLVIVYFARRHPHSLKVLGLGMFWITFAMFGGNLGFTVLAMLIPLNQPVELMAVTAGLLTLISVFVFQEKKETFAGWEMEGEDLFEKKTRVVMLQSTTHVQTEEKSIVKLELDEYEKFIRNYDLTVRETEILLLLLKGRNNPFIKEKLNISPNTLKFHLRNIYHKFTVKDRQELLSLFEKI